MRNDREALREIYPSNDIPDPAWMEIREFICPECGTLHEVEACPPGYPILLDFEPDLEELLSRLAERTAGGGMKRMGGIAGRAAVITGGLTGQGLAIASALAGQGANVAVGSFLGEQSGRADDAAAYPEAAIVAPIREALQAHGGKVHAGHLDVRDNGSVAHFVAAAEAACGAIDILVNAAGTTAEHPVCGHPDDLWNKIIDTNLTGAFRMIRAVLPGMIERGFGRHRQYRLDRGDASDGRTTQPIAPPSTG